MKKTKRVNKKDLINIAILLTIVTIVIMNNFTTFSFNDIMCVAKRMYS